MKTGRLERFVGGLVEKVSTRINEHETIKCQGKKKSSLPKRGTEMLSACNAILQIAMSYHMTDKQTDTHSPVRRKLYITCMGMLIGW